MATIFVGDGHGGDSNARIVKFSKDGKFIKTWGKKGQAPGSSRRPIPGFRFQRASVRCRPRNHRIQIFIRMENFSINGSNSARPAGFHHRIDKMTSFLIDENPAGLAELLPLIEKFSILIEDLDPVVPAVGNEQTPLESKAREWGVSNSPGACPFFPHV